MTNLQKFSLKFDTDSEAEASALAAELESTLRAENIPNVERRRENPNSMNLGDIITLTAHIITPLIVHLVVEFIMRHKAQIIVIRNDGTEFRTRGISPKQLAQALEEFMKVSLVVIPHESSDSKEENKTEK